MLILTSTVEPKTPNSAEGFPKRLPLEVNLNWGFLHPLTLLTQQLFCSLPVLSRYNLT